MCRYIPRTIISALSLLLLAASPAAAQPAGGAVYLDAAGDFIRVPDASSLDFDSSGATGPSFTLEGWFYSTTQPVYSALITKRNYTDPRVLNTNYGFRFDDGNLSLFWYTNDVLHYKVASSTSFTVGSWNHLAATYNGATKRVRLFVNGIEVPGYKDQNGNATTPYMTTQPVSNSWPLGIGASYSSAAGDTADQEFTGRIDEARISNIVRYSANFTPSTTAFVADSNTVLLLHLDQSTGLGSPNMVRDASSKGNDGQLVAGATIVSSTAPLRASSGNAVTMTGSQRLSIPSAASINFNAFDNFAVSLWFKTSGTGTQPLFTKNTSRYAGSVSSGHVAFSVNGSTITGTTTVNAGNWHYATFVRDAGTDSLRIYLDGQLEVQNAGGSGDITNSDSLFIGYDGANSFSGSIDEFRLEGALLSTNAGPTEPVRPTANTRVLLRMDYETGQTAKVQDESDNNNDAVIVGAPTFGASRLYLLSAAAGPANPGATSEASAATNVPVLQVRLDARGAPEQVNVSSIKLRFSGSGGDNTDIATGGVKLYRDVNGNGTFEPATDLLITAASGPTSDNGTVTLSTSGQTLASGDTTVWLVLLSLNTNAAIGETYQVSLVSTDISASGNTSGQVARVFGGTVTGGLKTISTTGTLTLSAGPVNPGNKTVLSNAAGVAMMQFSLVASSVETLQVHTITFTQEGTGAPTTDINKVTLYRDRDNNGLVTAGDDSIGGATGFAASGDTVRLSLTNVNLPAKPARDAEPKPGTEQAADSVDWEGLISNVPIVVKIDTTPQQDDSTGNGKATRAATPTGTLAAATGKLTVAAGLNNPASGTFPISRDSLEIFQISLTASKAEAITVSQIRFVGIGTVKRSFELDSVRLYMDANGNGLLDGAGDGGQLGRAAFAVGNDTVTFGGLSITVPKSASRYVLALIKTNARGVSGRTFSLSIPNKSALTATGKNPIIGDSLSMIVPLTSNVQSFETGWLTVSSTDISPAGVDTGAQNVAVLRLNFSVSGPAVTLKSIKVDNAYSGGSLGYAAADIESLKVYRDNGNLQYDVGLDSLVGRSLVTGSAGGSGTVTWATVDTVRSSASAVYLVVYDFATGGVGDPSHGFGAYLADSSYLTTAGVGSIRNTNFPIQTQNEKSLPVELAGFTVEAVHQAVIVRWVTASEVDNLEWVVERRTVPQDTAAARPGAFQEVHRQKGAGCTPYETRYEFIDRQVEPGTRYLYRLVDVSAYGVQTPHDPVEVFVPRPAQLALGRATPNPANPFTSWGYTLPEEQRVRLAVYNALGQEIRVLVDARMPAGTHRVNWDCSDAVGRIQASGTYFYVLEADSRRLVGRVTILR